MVTEPMGTVPLLPLPTTTEPERAVAPGSTVTWSMSPLSSRQTLRPLPPVAAKTTRSPLKSVNVSRLPTANNP